ncbi:MAG: MFS transporter [Deltaproteobacteria bacterium]|nr:MFS transporter [Deltaproteobacteria bacterium]
MRLAFASAGFSYGIIRNGINWFLLLYYSQVLGLSASLAGTALAIALGVDAISDPLVGRWSDRFHSRLGRRHPFLYFSIIPIGLLYFLVWAPPLELLSQWGLFTYLLLLSIALRLSLTLFIVPLNALVPELTSDYDERTALMNCRVSSQYFFDGLMRAGGYVEAGAIGGALAMLGILVAAAGTHPEIPRLRRAPAKEAEGVRGALAEYGETLSDGAVLALVSYGVIGAVAIGGAQVLWVYVQAYYWEFNSSQLSWMMVTQLIAAVLALVLTPVFANRRDKKPLLIWASIASIAIYGWPLVLRSLDLFLPNEHPLLFPLMLVNAVVALVFEVITFTITYSMMAEVVEARELMTGRREEGVLASLQTFVEKASSGLGALVGGVALDWIRFPTQVDVGNVPMEAVFRLGLVYGPVLMLIYFAALVPLIFYRIDRKTHLENLAKLRE